MEHPHDLIEKGKLYDKVKAERDLFLQQLKQLDESMDDSEIVIKQGSMYHLSIKRVIKEAEENEN